MLNKSGVEARWSSFEDPGSRLREELSHSSPYSIYLVSPNVSGVRCTHVTVYSGLDGRVLHSKTWSCFWWELSPIDLPSYNPYHCLYGDLGITYLKIVHTFSFIPWPDLYHVILLPLLSFENEEVISLILSNLFSPHCRNTIYHFRWEPYINWSLLKFTSSPPLALIVLTSQSIISFLCLPPWHRSHRAIWPPQYLDTELTLLLVKPHQHISHLSHPFTNYFMIGYLPYPTPRVIVVRDSCTTAILNFKGTEGRGLSSKC